MLKYYLPIIELYYIRGTLNIRKMKKGYHTPELTTSVLNTLEKMDVKAQDCSWVNDLTDSIWIQELNVIVYLPNPYEYDEDGVGFPDFFALPCDEDGGLTRNEVLCEGSSIGEIIDQLRFQEFQESRTLVETTDESRWLYSNYDKVYTYLGSDYHIGILEDGTFELPLMNKCYNSPDLNTLEFRFFHECIKGEWF